MATIRNDFLGTVVAANAEGDVLSLSAGQTIPTGFWVAGSAIQGGDAGDVRPPWYRDPTAGSKGPKGDPGTPGTNGTNGASGAAGTITAVTATALAAGATPTVTLGGTASARTIALGIPKGDKGDPGTPA